ncbi:MAG: GNAT family N-acetyltransferase [Candidatus Dormiibacterota bacterium]
MPTAEIAVREAGPDDAAAVAELLTQLGAVGVDPAEAERRLARGAERVLLAVADGRPAGLVAVMRSLYLGHAEPSAHVTAMVVGDAFRRRGIGRRLMVAAAEAGRSMGCAGIELTSALTPQREAAHAFYAALGYQRTSYRYWLPLS